MAKVGNGSALRKIPLNQIVCIENIRERYEDIEELAESIKTHGQLSPVLVKEAGLDEAGIFQYELIAGHRRYRAICLLCGNGESFTTIDALIVANGDKLTLQLVENLQRNDLTADERERGIWQLCRSITQAEAASRLSKPEMVISRNVLAYKVRRELESQGIKTGRLSTATLFTINTAPKKDYLSIIQRVNEAGGTKEAAVAVMRQYKTDQPPAAPKEGAKSVSAIIPGNSGKAPAARDSKKEADIPPSRQVDFRDVCKIIIEYRDALFSKLSDPPSDFEVWDVCPHKKLCCAFFKDNAADDILAELHDQFCLHDDGL